MNMTARELILQTANGRVDGPGAARRFARMVEDCGVEPLLKTRMRASLEVAAARALMSPRLPMGVATI